MPIIRYRSNRAARKSASVVDRSGLYRGQPYKSLRGAVIRDSGRGRAGKITVRHRGGGAKRMGRLIDFGQDKVGVPARVERLEYDPNRSANVALLVYTDGERRYALAWHGARAGDAVVTDAAADEQPGNRMQLEHITPGTAVYNVELLPGRGGKLFRAAGSSATVMTIQDRHALLRLPSGEVRMVRRECWATVGTVGNADHRLVRIGSAGRSRRLGRRPQVRGKAMNPVDHPHGGGEGSQSIGMKHPKTKWGRPALGVKTRRKRARSDALIVSRRARK
ncbi:MAG: 50S ribosomal protein L2, partial [Candidatus Andersenbacteria bacterium CG10_big_fil_rev_8_21_14_0_10_54_11]